MVDDPKILQTVFSAIDEINETLPVGRKVDKSLEGTLFGESGTLDSLGLITLIVTTEKKIVDVFGVTLTLANDKAMFQKDSPFRTVGALTDYIAALLKEKTL